MEQKQNFWEAFTGEPQPGSVGHLESLMDRLSGGLKTVHVKQTKKVSVELWERYKKAWTICYNKLSDFRKKEIDLERKNGTLGDKDRDKDFVRQVASLAESDDPLEA